MKKVLLTGLVLASLVIGGCGSTPVDEIKDATNLSQEQSQQVLTDLQSVGVSKFGNVNKASGQDGVYYVMDDNYGKTFFRIKDGKISEIENSFTTVYRNGQKVDDIADVFISDQQRATYQVTSEDAIKKQLKAPSTAKFEFKKVVRNKNKVVANGTVDAQNGFGAMVRGNFIVTINAESGAVEEAVIL